MKIFQLGIAHLLIVAQLATAQEGPVKSVDPLFGELYELAVTTILKERPPGTLFTLLLNYHEIRQRARPFPKDVEARIIKATGADTSLYVAFADLDFPSGKPPLSQVGNISTPDLTLTKKNTGELVEALRVGSIQWTEGNEVLVWWHFSGGPLSGSGGQKLFRFVDGHWKHDRDLERYAY